MTELPKIVRFLDKELKIADFKDSSNNGLQVENSGEVTRVCCGVDASMEFFEAAAKQRANLLICHHGISWGDSLKQITELNYRRLSFLIKHDMALYACHLPLDAHPRLGNNAQICKALNLRRIKPFGAYHGKTIGFSGELPKPVPYQSFKSLVSRVIRSRDLKTMDFGSNTVRTVGVISGGAGDQIADAGKAQLDVYLSGEPVLHAYNLAREYKINAVFAGHYATERFGVIAVGKELARKFHIKSEFIDLRVPF